MQKFFKHILKHLKHFSFMWICSFFITCVIHAYIFRMKLDLSINGLLFIFSYLNKPFIFSLIFSLFIISGILFIKIFFLILSKAFVANSQKEDEDFAYIIDIEE